MFRVVVGKELGRQEAHIQYVRGTTDFSSPLCSFKCPVSAASSWHPPVHLRALYPWLRLLHLSHAAVHDLVENLTHSFAPIPLLPIPLLPIHRSTVIQQFNSRIESYNAVQDNTAK